MYAYFDRFVRTLVLGAFAVSAATALLIMVTGSIDVLGTFLLNAPLDAAVEAQEALMAIVIFLAFASAQNRRQHIDVDIIRRLMPEAVQRGMYLFATLATLLIFAFFAWRSGALAADSWQIRETAAASFPFPLYPGKALVCLGAAIAALECVRQSWAWFRGEEETRRGSSADVTGI
jgi:TRAP-type C4-dicarboxylate transport system permease small subunit